MNMKKVFTFLAMAFVVFSANAQRVDATTGATEITVTTGAGYADEVYWGFETFNHTVARSAWDIAFTTAQMDVNILANNGNGVMLYTYPNGDIDDWDTVDTTGMAWSPMFNSIENWEMGAFLQNAVSGSDFDYGWGVYSMTTHNITGDSIFIIKVADSDYRKLAIIRKVATENQWDFKFANLDGTNEVTVNFDADDYSEKHFIHYSIIDEQLVEQEPAAADWQLLFTKYYDYTIPYYVSGVLAKSGVAVQEVRESGLNQETFTDYDEAEFSENISTIGSDWKSFNMGTMQYDIVDTVVYFVRELPDGDIWKMYFTEFGGSSNGNYVFMQENLSATGINDINQSFSTVYPNPVASDLNIIYDIDGECTLSVYNMTGQLIYSENIRNNEHLNKHSLNVSGFQSGIYNLVIKGKTQTTSTKFIKQ